MAFVALLPPLLHIYYFSKNPEIQSHINRCAAANVFEGLIPQCIRKQVGGYLTEYQTYCC